MKDVVLALKEFHTKFGVPVVEHPSIPDETRVRLRASLITEESAELINAIETGNLIEIADGIADLVYVAIGTALEFGLPIEAVFAEVHRTNMLKVGGPTRSDGKIMKPEGWTPPDIGSLLVVKE